MSYVTDCDYCGEIGLCENHYGGTICSRCKDGECDDKNEDACLDDDRDQENPCEFSENYDWSKWDFESDPDWR